ncbi:Crp/Fnr family transcriptional regulator [Sphingomonas profundi]|uniref:Crp/Fnr family transcriptional regulator n=1 Tax=Alterirhizorhabdus profundi TaxID=2681549 RepID=UPI0012E91450|nr:cyclic nucleotide-binding domain-containing protein [Sphingomonas profundi]
MREVHSILAGLSDADMVWLLSVGSLRTLKTGERLVEAKRPIDDLFFVVGGSLVVLRADNSRVATLNEGQVIGEMSFIDRTPPSVTVRADARTEVLMIPRNALEQRFEREPVFAARFYRAIAFVLSERLRRTTAALRPAHELEGDADAGSPPGPGDRFRTLVSMLLRKGD